MTDGVTKRYELTATRDVIYDVISSNITDPLTGEQARSEVSDWVFKGVPETAKLGSLYKYPIVIIPYPGLSDENKVVDGSKDMSTLSTSIQVHARTRKDCTGTDVKGRTEANSLVEEIRYILKVTGTSELKKAALFGPNVIGTTLDTEFVGGNKLYILTMEVEFKRFD